MSEKQAEKKIVKKDTKKKSKAGRITLITVLAVLVFAVVSFGIYASSYNGIFPNVYVGDCALGGMSEQEALSTLNDAYYIEKVQGASFSMICKGNQAELAVNDLQVSFDNQASVEAAVEKSTFHNIFTKTYGLVTAFFTKTEVEPVIDYDEAKLEETFASIAGEYEIEPQGHTYEIKENEVVLHGRVDGIKAERAPLIAQVKKQLCSGSFETITLEPKAVSAEPLDADEFYEILTGEPVDAYYQKDENNKVVIQESKYQCTVDKATVKNALSTVDEAEDKTVTFPVTTKAPKVTSKDLKEQLYKDVLGSYSTYYSGSAARNNNVQLAASRINGTEMMPGDEFSYDKTILPRTYANGYQAAPVFVGNRVESGLGGGICQPSSTLYCAALYANLEILERHNHSMMVGYMPAGLDATIAEGYLDLRFKNNTAYPIKIAAVAEGGKLTFTIYGYNPENISVELLRSGGGYGYSVTRVVKKDGQEVSREQMGSSQYSPKETTPKPSDKPQETTKPEAKPSSTSAPAASETDTAPAPAPEPAPAPAPAPDPAPAPAPAPDPAPAPAPAPAPDPAPAE